MEERLQKYLSECGIASRRSSEKLITDGLISVNGMVVNELGTKVNPETDIVKYKGKIVKRTEKNIYIALNKPLGYITTMKDEFNRPKVVDLLKGVKEKVYPVGRLDYNSSGLLLLTNDGELTYKLTHPGHQVNKEYIVRIKGVPDETSLKNLRSGVLIDGYITSPAVIDIILCEKNYTTLRFLIHEGRNRQIRKMCSSVGHDVIELKRVSIGNLKLGDLKEGEWRYLSDLEISFLKSN